MTPYKYKCLYEFAEWVFSQKWSETKMKKELFEYALQLVQGSDGE